MKWIISAQKCLCAKVTLLLQKDREKKRSVFDFQCNMFLGWLYPVCWLETLLKSGNLFCVCLEWNTPLVLNAVKLWSVQDLSKQATSLNTLLALTCGYCKIYKIGVTCSIIQVQINLPVLLLPSSCQINIYGHEPLLYLIVHSYKHTRSDNTNQLK